MLFSIITPAFRQLDWLRLCIASVADQVEGGKDKIKEQTSEEGDLNSYSPLEIEHIVQDGGTPGIVEFVAVLTAELNLTILPSHEGESLRASKPGYMLVLVSEADHGMYDAINRGIARMTGDLWAWLNCDEQYLPGTLLYAAEWFATHQEIDILCGDALLVDGEGRALSYRRIVPPQWLHTRLVHLSSLSCAAFYRRSVIARGGGFDTAWRSIGDAEWMARLLKAGLRVEVCHRLLSSFAFTGQNTSESPLACQEAARWRKSPDAPSSWMKVPVTIHHRMRRFLAGAYQYRSFSYSLYRNGGGDRVEYRAGKVGWNWPVGGDAGKREKAVLSRASDCTFRGSVLGIPTVPVLGCDLAVTSYADLFRKLTAYTRNDLGPLVVDFANTHVITLRCHDVEFAAWSKSSDVTAPDGMPLVWVMNRRGAVLKDRVYGPTFTREFLASCPPDKTHYLVGGSVECGEKFRMRMLALNPSLKFVGSYHGRCDAAGVLQDDEAVLREIREKRPDFIWVGLGAPKQYAWIHRIKPRIERGVILAVGFAFDVNAGMKLDTPAWMQRLGLGWLHRMASEPKRLVGRYLKYNSLFLWYLMREEVRGKNEVRRIKYEMEKKDSGFGIQDSRDGEFVSKSERIEIPERKLVTSVHRPDTMKLRVRNLGLQFSDLFASDILDCVTGKKLGRGLLIGFGGWIRLIGYEGRPLVPKFLMQPRLTYWKQGIGFTAQEAPDFPRLFEPPSSEEVRASGGARVMNVLLTHQGGENFDRVKKLWRRVCAEEDLWVAFGGSREEFETLDYPRKVYIDDPRLRVRDQQRDKQCYGGIFRVMAPIIEREQADFVYLCEYDHIPLVDDLNERQVAAIQEEGADVMGHWLYRVDGTGHYHLLYHEADLEFFPFWRSVSRRADPSVIFSMFGSGSFWRRTAFLAVAAQQQMIECYQEIYLPTLAHHLGFRIREWKEEQHLISNIPTPEVSVENARQHACWTVHPVKRLSEN